MQFWNFGTFSLKPANWREFYSTRHIEGDSRQKDFIQSKNASLGVRAPMNLWEIFRDF